MNTRIVSWAKKGNEQRALVALKLLEEKNEVESYAFSEDVVTEDFEKQLRHSWKSGADILFPDHEKHTTKLSITEPIIPSEFVLEDQDFVNRIKTEWTFVVLSFRLKASFEDELESFKKQVDELSSFDSGLWNDLKGFWNKVQTQARERNLFKDHADNLRDHTNVLFGQLKEIRNKANKEFAVESEKVKSKFEEVLNSVESKVDKGLSLHPIFQELKDIQNRFKTSKMTRGDRDKVWDKLDNLFKKVKEKRFGADGDRPRNSSSDRVQRRLDGLVAAIQRMDKSIRRDEKDLKYEESRIGSVGNQLETQLRSAKIDMIKQRIDSKKSKFDDMLKTQGQLEKKIERLRIKQEQEKAKEEIKGKIAQEIQDHHEHIMDNPKVVKAFEEVTTSTQQEPSEVVSTSIHDTDAFDSMIKSVSNFGKLI